MNREALKAIKQWLINAESAAIRQREDFERLLGCIEDDERDCAGDYSEPTEPIATGDEAESFTGDSLACETDHADLDLSEDTRKFLAERDRSKLIPHAEVVERIHERGKEEVLRVITGQMTMGELAKATGATSDELRPILKKLMADGLVTAAGVRRGVRYSIAAKAAE